MVEQAGVWVAMAAQKRGAAFEKGFKHNENSQPWYLEFVKDMKEKLRKDEDLVVAINGREGAGMSACSVSLSKELTKMRRVSGVEGGRNRTEGKRCKSVLTSQDFGEKEGEK